MLYTIKSNADFEKKLNDAGQKLVLLDFYATWCGPCKEMDPVMKALSKQHSSNIMILKVNVDKFEELSDYYKVRSMPTFVFIKNKKKVGGFAGADEDSLKRKISKLIKT